MGERVAYAVTTGECSGYEVHALFEKEEDAEGFVRRLKENARTRWTCGFGVRVEPFPYQAGGDTPLSLDVV